MAALLVREGLDVAGDRALGHYTHEKSSLGCAAALATIEVIESEGLLERATRLGARALQRLREMQARLPAIVEVRGVGLLLAIELAEPGIAEEAMYRCLSRGLSFKVGQGNVIVLAPPLIIEEADLERALEIVEQAISKRCHADRHRLRNRHRPGWRLAAAGADERGRGPHVDRGRRARLEKAQGGRALLGGVPGVAPAKVVIIGAGVVGTNAMQMAVGTGAHVTVLDTAIDA